MAVIDGIILFLSEFPSDMTSPTARLTLRALKWGQCQSWLSWYHQGLWEYLRD